MKKYNTKLIRIELLLVSNNLKYISLETMIIMNFKTCNLFKSIRMNNGISGITQYINKYD